VAQSRDLDAVFSDLTRNASKVFTRGRVLVEADEHGSHHATAVEVPIEVIRELAENVQEARALMREADAARRAA